MSDLRQVWYGDGVTDRVDGRWHTEWRACAGMGNGNEGFSPGRGKLDHDAVQDRCVALCRARHDAMKNNPFANSLHTWIETREIRATSYGVEKTPWVHDQDGPGWNPVDGIIPAPLYRPSKKAKH